MGKAHASLGTPRDSHYLLGDMCIQLPHEKARVTTKTRGVISSLGEIIAHDMSYSEAEQLQMAVGCRLI